MSFAIGFVSFPEGQVKRDTIPKPVGLGPGDPRRALSVRHLSGIRPALIRYLSGICPTSVRLTLIQLRSWGCGWKANSRTFLTA